MVLAVNIPFFRMSSSVISLPVWALENKGMTKKNMSLVVNEIGKSKLCFINTDIIHACFIQIELMEALI